MAFKAINLTKTVRYQSELDSEFGTDKATTFILGPIDTRTMSYIIDANMESKVNSDGEQSMKFNQLIVAFNLVKFGLKGFENYLDENDQPLVYKTEKVNFGGKHYTVVSEDILSMLPQALLMELAAKINDINTVSETDEKN